MAASYCGGVFCVQYFAPGSLVLALYPQTTCFYPAKVHSVFLAHVPAVILRCLTGRTLHSSHQLPCGALCHVTRAFFVRQGMVSNRQTRLHK